MSPGAVPEWSPARQSEEIREIRERLVEQTLLVMLPLGLVGLAGSLVRSIKLGDFQVFVFHCGAYGIIAAMYALRRRIPTAASIALILGLFLAIAVRGIFAAGLMGFGVPLSFAFAVLATIFLGMRAGLALSGAVVALLAALGFLVTRGVIVVPVDAAAYVVSPQAWIFTITSTALFLGIIVMALRVVQSSLTASVGRLRGEVGERARAEEALRQSEARMSAILESIPVGMALLDPQGAVIYANTAALRTFGVDRGRGCSGVFLDPAWGVTGSDGCPVGLAQLPFAQVLADGQMQMIEVALRTADGRAPTLSLTLVAHRDAAGRTQSVAVAFQDVAERRAIECELRKMHRLESLGVFAGGIAHDFNNILTGITANVTLARQFPIRDAKLDERLAAVEKAALRAAGLTRQLLTFSHGGEPQRRVILLGELVAESCSFAVHGSNSRCYLGLADDLWPVNADEAQLQQVLQNLVLNAVQAMPDGGVVSVRASNREITAQSGLPLTPGRYVQITVADHGTGIPPAIRDRVFDPFFTTKPKGSGLGLALVYSIVTRHDGVVSFESDPGEGTIFTVLLPAVEDAPAREPAPPVAAPASLSRPHQGRARVLVMDDEESVLAVCGEALTVLGHSADCVADGSEAVRRFAAAAAAGSAYDLVVLDLTIPGGMGGVETLAALRKIDPRVKAVVSSGYSDDPTLARPADYGFDDVISKPYTFRQLDAAISRVLGS